jgi:hypothetical protein
MPSNAISKRITTVEGILLLVHPESCETRTAAAALQHTRARGATTAISLVFLRVTTEGRDGRLALDLRALLVSSVHRRKGIFRRRRRRRASDFFTNKKKKIAAAAVLLVSYHRYILENHERSTCHKFLENCWNDLFAGMFGIEGRRLRPGQGNRCSVDESVVFAMAIGQGLSVHVAATTNDPSC